MMLHSTLTDVVHTAVCLVSVKRDVGISLLTDHLVRVHSSLGTTAGCLEGSLVDHLHQVVAQLGFHCLDERIFPRTTVSSEVVQVHRPDHDASEPLVLQPAYFCLQRPLVIEADPLLVAVGEGDLLLVVPDQGGVVLVQEVADLVVGEEAGLARVPPGVSPATLAQPPTPAAAVVCKSWLSV